MADKERPLTNTQIQHVKMRVTELKQAKLAAYAKTLPKKTNLPKPTLNEMLVTVRNGKATFKKDEWDQPWRRASAIATLEELFDFPHNAEQKKAKAANDAIDKQYEAKGAELNKKADRLLDEMILSPNGDYAMQLLAKFAKD